MSVIQIFISLIIYLSVVYSVILLARKNRNITDIILAVWLVFVAISYSVWSVRWQLPLSFTHCVFCYLYVKCMIQQDGFKVKYLSHFIPSFIVLLLCIFFPDVIFARQYVFIRFGILILYQSLYFGAAIRLLINHKKQNKDTEINLSWLYMNVGITILFHAIYSIPPVIYYAFGIYLNRTIVTVISFLLLNIIGIVALKMNLIFKKEPKSEKTKNYSTYNIKESEIILLEQKLKDLMTIQKLYLEPELSLKDLSEKLGVSSHHLSYILNIRFNQNFYEFINSYRLEKVKNELINPQNKNLSIVAIAYDCGFNSQSTFNRFFKQKEGISPSKYREQSTANI